MSQYYYTTERKEESAGSLRNGGLALPFNMEQSDGIFILLLLCFLFFTHIYNGGLSFIKQNISLLFFSDKHKEHRQTTVREIVYSYFLLFQVIVLISICLYDMMVEYDSANVITSPFFTVLTFILLTVVFLWAKDVIYKFVGFVFNQQRLMNTWRRISVVGLEMLGILYFIPTLLLIYSDFYHTEIFILMLVLFIIVQLVLFYQIISFFVNQKFNFLYLIAYLCTVEILPYIFLSTGLIYLYRIDIFNILWL